MRFGQIVIHFRCPTCGATVDLYINHECENAVSAFCGTKHLRPVRMEPVDLTRDPDAEDA